MLLEFRFENFRSFKDEARLSMLPVNSYKEREGNVRPVEIPGTGASGVLTTAAIYGGNASGKTNLLRAVHFSRNLILGLQHPGGLIRRQCFAGSDEPSRFGYTFFTGGTRYEYDFAIDRNGALEEELRVRPRAERLVYRRSRREDGTYEVKQGSKYSGIAARLKGFADGGLVLGLLANYGFAPCVAALDWFANDLAVANRENPIPDSELMEKLAALGQEKFERVIKTIGSADLDIVGVQLDVDEMSEDEKAAQREKKDRIAALLEALTGTKPGDVELSEKKVALQFRHLINGRGVGFGLDEESLGTLTMLDLAADFIDAIDSGKALFVDEVERSLHPVLLESLVALFCNPELNEKGAQLVFTTHDLSFLRNERLRRDQIWFVEKDPESGASDAYPLSSFSPRKDESLMNRYLHGAYGAVPFVEELI